VASVSTGLVALAAAGGDPAGSGSAAT